MTRSHIWIALIAALAWGPVSSWCLIESSGLVESGECCGSEGEKGPSLPKRCDKPCGVISSGDYWTGKFDLAGPLEGVAGFASAGLSKESAEAADGTGSVLKAPIARATSPQTWAFLIRAAGLARSP